MTEVYGLCKSNDEEKMIIIDDDGDEIEMCHEGYERMKDWGKIMKYFDTLVGKRISYYYDREGIKVQLIKDTDKGVHVYQVGKTPSMRTLQSIFDQNK